jgi:hypothetical protein
LDARGTRICGPDCAAFLRKITSSSIASKEDEVVLILHVAHGSRDIATLLGL